MGKPGQIDDLSHERSNWKIEHWGWAGMGAVAFAGLLGLLGNGPLSKATVGRKDSNLWVEYNRYERYQAPAAMRLHVGKLGLSTALPALTINREYVDKVDFERIVPEPEQVKAAGEDYIYIFNFAATNQPATITLHLKPTGYGKVPVRLKFSD